MATERFTSVWFNDYDRLQGIVILKCILNEVVKFTILLDLRSYAGQIVRPLVKIAVVEIVLVLK